MIRVPSTLGVLRPAIVCGVSVAPRASPVDRVLVLLVGTASELAKGMGHGVKVFSSRIYAVKG